MYCIANELIYLRFREERTGLHHDPLYALNALAQNYLLGCGSQISDVQCRTIYHVHYKSTIYLALILIKHICEEHEKLCSCHIGKHA